MGAVPEQELRDNLGDLHNKLEDLWSAAVAAQAARRARNARAARKQYLPRLNVGD